MTKSIPLPSHVAPSGALDRLAETARDYARQATAENTNKAYAADWAHYTRWCRQKGADPLSPCPASDRALYHRLRGHAHRRHDRAAPLGPRLGLQAARADAGPGRPSHRHRPARHQAQTRPPRQKAAVDATDILAILATLPHDLRGLRDRAILPLGFAGGFRRSELVTLDVNRDDNDDGQGWIETLDQGSIVTIQGKTGWREVAIGRGSKEKTCPVHALEQWSHFARVNGN